MGAPKAIRFVWVFSTSARVKKLIDVTDRKTRRTQQASAAAASALGAIGAVLLVTEAGPALAAWAALGAAAALLALTASIRQRWDIAYKGHRIRFENSAVLAERMYLDEGLVARGGLGKKTELRAPIRVGEGAGETVVALVDAGLLSFRLRLFVEPPESAPDAADAMHSQTQATLVEPPRRQAAVGAAPASVTTDSALLGGVVVAKQAIEFLAAVIGLIGGLGALIGWLYS